MRVYHDILAACALLTVIAIVLTGCGSANGRNTTGRTPVGGDNQPGSIRVCIQWPSNRSGTRAIPPNTNRIVLMVEAPDIDKDKSPAIIIERPDAGGTTNATINGIPPGFGRVVTAVARMVNNPGNGVITNPSKDQLNEGTVLGSGTSDHITLVPLATSSVTITISPGTPPLSDERYVIGGSIIQDPTNPGTIIVTLNALLNRVDGTPITGLSASNFSVYEDGIIRNISSVSETGSGATTSRADIAFLIDSTGSMKSEIQGVQDSVRAFAEYIKGKGVDVRLGGIEFRDVVGTSLDLTSDYGSFESWVSSLVAYGGGDDPENDVDTVMQAINTLSWRAGAQHIIVVITDATTHQSVDTYFDPGEPSHYTLQQVIDALKSKAFVLDSISPGGTRGIRSRSMTRHGNYGSKSIVRDDYYPDISEAATATGGLAMMMPSDGAIDLTVLPLAKIVISGYTIKFNSIPRGLDHSIRLVVAQDGNPVADKDFAAHY